MSSDRLKQLLEFLSAKPDDSFLLFAIAKEYEQNNDLSKALNYYKQLQNKDPEYLGLYFHLAKLYEIIQEDRLALAVYEQGIALAKEKGDFHALSELNNAQTNLKLQLGN